MPTLPSRPYSENKNPTVQEAPSSVFAIREEHTGKTLRDWLREAPFTLAMSSGFFGFFAHCGVLHALEEEGILPARAAGSSAGALITGAWAAGVEAARLRDELLSLHRKDFWDLGFGLGLLKGKLFQERLERLLPVHTFAECRIPLSLSLYDLRQRTTAIRQEGALIPAIQASCAFPFLFQPVRIEDGLFLDGGIADRPGLQGVPFEERIFFHHLASRSPWRRRQSPALRLPQRPHLAALILHNLPRVSPFRLERGQIAYERAYQAAHTALDQPIHLAPASLL